jgi:pyridoxine kinase
MILSVQSHVVHGYVGNKASTFPLQLLGFEVDPLNTVQFSNHKRYPICTGMAFDMDHFRVLFDGLIDNGFVKDYTHILTGYIGTPRAISAISNEIKRVKELNSDVKVVIDPVLGDDGRLYVETDCVPAYIQILSLADLITPNGFEAEY